MEGGEGPNNPQNNVPTSLTEYRQLKEREDIGVDRLIKALEADFTPDQKEKAQIINGVIPPLAQNAVEPRNDALIDFANNLGDNKLSFFALAIFSRERVKATHKGLSEKEVDRMAGDMLDDVAKEWLESQQKSES